MKPTFIIIDDPLRPDQPIDKEAALKWFEKTMGEARRAGVPVIAHAIISRPRHMGMSVVREAMREFRAMRRVEEALDENRFLGTCVRVIRNVGRSDFPDIDQMLQDLQGLPSPDDPLYEVSLSHG